MKREEILDTWRTVIPTWQLGLYTLSPIVILFILSTTPIHILSTKLKSALALPLLALLVIVPLHYREPDNGAFGIFCQMIPFTMFLRFTDVFVIHPVIYKKDAYVPFSELNAELWSCIRKDRHNKNKASKQEKEIIKDKKFYQLFPELIFNAVMFDICIVWAKTFTAQDVYTMQKSHSVQAALFFIVGITLMTSLLNVMGKVMQLAYCLYMDQGTYASEEWRNMMDYPLLGISLDEIWSHRWHRVLRPAWVSSAYKPVFFLIRQWTQHKPLAIGLAAMAVFVASGITHEYAVLCNSGWQLYRQQFMGQEMIFFGLQGILVILEKIAQVVLKPVVPSAVVKSPLTRMLRHIYVLGVAYVTFPYFINSFAHWGFYKLGSLTPVEPLLTKYVASQPYLRQFCGSYGL